MHIIFLTHYFPPEVNAPANRTFEHCRHWVRKGQTVTVVTCVPNAPEGIVYPGYRNRFYSRENREGIGILRVWTYLAANKGFIRRTLNYVSFMLTSLWGAFFIKGGDVVVATSPQFFCALAGYGFSRLKRIPFIVEIRDLWPDSILAVDAIRSPAVIRFLKMLELFIYRKASKIIVLTDTFKEIIMQKGIPGDKIAVIKNGVDLDFFCPHSSGHGPDLKKEFQWQGRFITSYIGTLGMAHDLVKVLDLAERLGENKNLLFLLVGSGAQKEFLLAEKNRRKLENVVFFDKQPRERIAGFYAASDLCLVTLKKDKLFEAVLPSKIFEIMAMGKPILLGVGGETKRLVVDQAQAGVPFEMDNPADFEEQFNRLYADPCLRETLGRRGRSYVEKKFCRKRLAEDLLSEIEKTLSGAL